MMSDVTKKLNQHMPHDDFMAECNAIDIYVEDLEKDSKKAYMLEIDFESIDGTLSMANNKINRLEEENENLSMGIKGMARAKVNLNESYQDLEKLYERLEKENAALVKENEELKGLIEPMLDVIGAVRLVSSAAYKCIRPDFIEKLKQAGSK